ncbi:MAG TPA: hypothetical protein VFZ53_05350 [Polyangiaceae bacterium]
MNHPGDALSELPDLVSTDASRRYERWLAEQSSDDAYLFTDAKVRFDARQGDVLIPAPGLVARASDGGTRLDAPSLAAGVEVSGVRPEEVERFVAALDGERTLGKAIHTARLANDTIRAILDAGFGRMLFAPLAVLMLERAVPSAEVVRFPGTPYEIPRNYWQNMASVRKLSVRFFERLGEPRAALEELRRLHAVALLGEDETSFYRPASPIAKKGIGPSRLWLAASRTIETDAGTRFVEGPRVGARFLGGDRYGTLLATRAGDARATSERLEHRDAAGLDWGRVVVARADGDAEALPWFCPPRPITERHVASLFGSLALGDVADFHQKFMRLHPFRAANQALAMNLVNAALGRRTGSPHGGIPHLVLDHLAFRLSPEAYRKVFELALREWVVTGSPAERLHAYAERKRLYYGFVDSIAGSRDDAEAQALARASTRAARLALLVPEA